MRDENSDHYATQASLQLTFISLFAICCIILLLLIHFIVDPHEVVVKTTQERQYLEWVSEGRSDRINIDTIFLEYWGLWWRR